MTWNIWFLGSETEGPKQFFDHLVSARTKEKALELIKYWNASHEFPKGYILNEDATSQMLNENRLL